MKKLISIRTQYIFMWIPFLNVLVLFMWLYNYNQMEKRSGVFGKSLFVLFASTIPLVAVQIIVSRLLGDGSTAAVIIDRLMLYLIPFSMAFNMIRYQKTVLASIQTGDSCKEACEIECGSEDTDRKDTPIS